MTDRELLELAAKAYGLYTEPVDARDWVAPSSLPVDNYYENNGPTWGLQVVGGLWNPLEDDGDALRLAVKLGLSPEVHLDAAQPLPWLRVVHRSRDARGVYGENWEHAGPKDYGADPYAATRRAIVRAAAEIGRSM